MKYTVEMASGGMTHTPCLMKTGTDIYEKSRFCLRNLRYNIHTNSRENWYRHSRNI
jgi:hypothetical protein